MYNTFHNIALKTMVLHSNAMNYDGHVVKSWLQTNPEKQSGKT